MTTTLAVARTSWRGRVLASGLWLSRATPDLASRVINAWGRGARLYGLDGGVIVLWPRPARVDVRAADGAPLVDIDGVLSAAPLKKRERARFAPSSIVLVSGGVARAIARASLAEVEPSALVDVSGIAIIDVEPLGRVAPVPPPPKRPPPDLRSSLLGTTEVDPLRDDVARAVREGLPKEESGLRGARAREVAGIPSTGIGESMLRALARAMENAGLMEKVRQAHRKYIEDTLEQLKAGKIEDALKRAIPLSGGGGGGPSLPTLGLPLPRINLNIGAGGGAPPSSIDVDNDLYARIRNSYREAAKKLEKDGRFREAAFVYIELLGETYEAIAVLERSKDKALLKLAAEIAESRGLPPENVVRQWIIAGDLARAIRLARRHRVFPGAIAALERSQRSDDAELLRAEHAEILAQAGDHARAVAVLWDRMPRTTPLVKRFIEEGLKEDGEQYAALLAFKLTIDERERPSDKPRLLDQVRRIIDDDGPSGARDRLALAQGIANTSSTLAHVRAELMRRLIADAAQGWADRATVLRLSKSLGDAALRFDMPPNVNVPAPRHASHALTLDGPGGLTEPRDVALAPRGVLAALGEAGAVIVSANGRMMHHIREPAEGVSVSGDRAILVARRGEVLRLTKLNLATGKAEHWIDVRAHTYSKTFDGEVFFVARDRTVLALDVLSDKVSALWQMTSERHVSAIAANATSFAVALPEQIERYGLPAMNTIERRPSPLMHAHALSTTGIAVGLGVDPARLAPPYPGEMQGAAAAGEDRVAVCYDGESDGLMIVTCDAHPPLRIEVVGAAATSVRFQHRAVVIGDSRGRVFVVDVARGTTEIAVAVP